MINLPSLSSYWSKFIPLTRIVDFLIFFSRHPSQAIYNGQHYYLFSTKEKTIYNSHKFGFTLTRAQEYSDALANIVEPIKEKDLVMLVIYGLREEYKGLKSTLPTYNFQLFFQNYTVWCLTMTT